MRRKLFVAAIALGCAGCNPKVFDDLERDAPIVALKVPDFDRTAGFGAVLTSFVGTFDDGRRVSRIAASGGSDSGTGVYGIWGADGIELGPAPFSVCGDLATCDPGAGAALAGIPTFAGEELCAIVGQPTDGSLRVICESRSGMTRRVPGPLGTELGASVAGIPAVGHALGVAVVGAPGDAGGEGRLYRVTDGGAVADPLAAPTGLTLGAGDRLGERIVLHEIDATTVLVAASLARSNAGAVVLLRIVAGSDPEALGCVEGATPGFGRALAFGDLDMDGVPELAIGSDPDAIGRLEDVLVFDTAALETGFDCAGGALPAATPGDGVVVACAPGMRGVDCVSAGFGGSLAIGDVDLDGFGDLAVGAPRAVVSGKGSAGAVFLFAGSLAGVGADRVDVLRHQSPKTDDRLGESLAMAWSHLGGTSDAGSRERVEVVAGAPGREKLYVFLCTGLESADPSFAHRCLD